MCADELHVAFVIPKVDAFSGGIERSLKLLEYSESANIRYTVFLPAEGVPNAEVGAQVAALERAGKIDTRPLTPRHNKGGFYDVTAIPTEYWWGAWKRAKASGLRAPYCFDFHQLPYIGTLDILKAIHIDDPVPVDIGRVPFLQKKVYGDGLVDSAFQTAASVASVRWISRLGDGRIMAVTPVVAKNLAALGYRGPAFVPKCPNGIDRAFVENHAEVQAPLEFDGVFVGRFHPQKGFLDLPPIVARLKELTGREVMIAVCGGSALEKHLARFRDMARSLGIDKNLRIFGRIPKADLFRTVCRSKLLLYPSYVDGFSLTVLESLSLGVPVVAYDIDAMRMIWSRWKAVVRSPVGNPQALAEAAARVLEDAHLADARKSARTQSRQLLDEYTWQKVVADEREFYETTMSATASGG